jgi:uncharacterized membrane protein affecting hemolysin expression
LFGGERILSQYEEDITRLIKFVDENFKSIGLIDVLKASEMFLATTIALIVLYGYLIALAPFNPISVQIPWALSFSAVILAAASFMQASRKSLRKQLVKQQFARIYPLLKNEEEPNKIFLTALLTMKIENPNIKLSVVYDIDKKLFDEEQLLKRLYE